MPKMIAGAFAFVTLGVTGSLVLSPGVCAGSVYAAQAQTANAVGLKTNTSKQPSLADYSQEPFVYEQVRGKMRYESNGTGTREIFARLHVQTPAGLARAGQLIFEYNADTERIEIRSVRVIEADGRVITVGPNAVQDLSSPVTREAPMYTDMRQQHVTVPGLAVGDYIEYDVVVTTFEALLPGQFWQTWSFVDGAICLDEEVDLDVPRARALKLKSPPDVTPLVREEADRRIYHWATSTLSYSGPKPVPTSAKFDVKALLEGARPAATRSIRFSTFQTWGEIGAWYARLERDRRVATPEIRTLADQIVIGKTTDIEKVRALYQWVSGNIRYVSLSFGVGWYQPHAASDVLQNRYGDCKDKTTLLEALLEAEGFHGSPALANATTDIDPDLPTPHQFDHVITLLSLAGHDYWLDTTIGVGPFGYLLPQLRGKSVLVATAFTLETNIHVGSISGAILATSLPTTIVPPSLFASIVTPFTFSVPVSLVPGDLYVFDVVAISGDALLGSTDADSYLGGTQILGGLPQPNNDLWFQEGILVPEPGTLVLLATGMIGLLASGWGRNRLTWSLFRGE